MYLIDFADPAALIERFRLEEVNSLRVRFGVQLVKSFKNQY